MPLRAPVGATEAGWQVALRQAVDVPLPRTAPVILRRDEVGQVEVTLF
jgi:hypothetical protein